MIIDAHCHLGGPDKGDGVEQSLAELIKRMDDCKVDMAVVFPFNDKNAGVSFSNSNAFIASAVRESKGRVIGFGRLDPHAREKAILEAKRCLEDLNLKGFKLHPTAQKFFPDHPFVLKILRIAAKYGVPVVFDNGKPESKNLEIAEVARQVPEAKIIIAHMRGDGFIEACKEAENLYLGTVKAKVDDIIMAIDELGADRIIAGSDSPYASMYFEMVDKFEQIESLSDEEKEKIRGKNMAKLLGI